MSRGHGAVQRLILDAIEKTDKLVPLGGCTRSERAALVRAAKLLERSGKCAVVRLWNVSHTALAVLVCKPGTMIGGKPARDLSVARVTSGTRATLTGSLRQIAVAMRCRHVTVWRDIRRNARSSSQPDVTTRAAGTDSGSDETRFGKIGETEKPRPKPRAAGKRIRGVNRGTSIRRE
jgi:hypothetical protein